MSHSSTPCGWPPVANLVLGRGEATLREVVEEEQEEAADLVAGRQMIDPAEIERVSPPDVGGDPTVRTGGNLYLRIEGVPFVLYLGESGSRVEARLEARQLDLPERAKKKAREFLQEVADQTARRNG